jgi:hypothetical protein
MEWHDVVNGVVQCFAPPPKPLTKEQMLEAAKWAAEHPIETTDG